MLKYDKLKNLNIDNNYFEFKCPHCNSDGFKKGNWTLTPIGISWKPDLLDNSDLKNDVFRKGYDRLPDLRAALVMAARKISPDSFDETIEENKSSKYKEITNNNARISIYCNKCKHSITQVGKLDVPDVRKWCNNNLEFYMDLSPKKK